MLEKMDHSYSQTQDATLSSHNNNRWILLILLTAVFRVKSNKGTKSAMDNLRNASIVIQS